MKKHAFFIFFSLILFSWTLSFAQPSLGFSMALGSPTFDDLPGHSFNFGLVTEYPLADHIGLRSGIQYASRKVGAGYMYEGPVWNLNTFYLPVIFSFKMPVKKIELYVNAGSAFGLISNPDHKIVDATGENPVWNVDFRKYEYTLILGTGVKFKTKKAHLFFEINHRQSLNDLTEVEDEYDLKIVSAELVNIGVLIPVRPLE